jgi:hypothetical protein
MKRNRNFIIRELERGKTIENMKARLPFILVLEVEESKAMYYVYSLVESKRKKDAASIQNK